MSRIKDAFDAVANAIISQKDYLSGIDAKAGDGDHGFNMARGFSAARDAVDEMEDTTRPGPVLKTIGKALIQNVGGAAGPLFGAAFVKAGEACDDDTAMNKQSFVKLLDAAVEAIQTRGRAQQGDKTILDALIPLRDAFLPENTEDKNLYEVLQEASKAVGDGVSYTKTIPARKGRASLVGERSIGVEDPGAVSTMIMYRALYQFLKY